MSLAVSAVMSSFAIILPETTADRAVIFVDRVKNKLDQIELSIDGYGWRILNWT